MAEINERKAKRYKLSLKDPVDIHLAKELKEIPPQPPPSGSMLSIMIWSLKLRYWSWSRDNYDSPKDIQIFVVYFDPELDPVWPQKKAEIMGGRIPINKTKAKVPQNLEQTVIGKETANEILWTEGM